MLLTLIEVNIDASVSFYRMQLRMVEHECVHHMLPKYRNQVIGAI